MSVVMFILAGALAIIALSWVPFEPLLGICSLLVAIAAVWVGGALDEEGS